MNVVDNTGAALGTVSEVSTVQGQQVATVNMDGRRFSVPVGALAVANGRATINLTRAQIESQLPAASSAASSATTPSSSASSTPSSTSSSTTTSTRSTTSSNRRGHSGSSH